MKTSSSRKKGQRGTTSITRVMGWSLLLVALIPFLPMAFMSWMDYQRSVGQIEQEIQSTNQQLARLAGHYLDRFLSQVRQEAQQITSYPDDLPALSPGSPAIRWEVVGGDRQVEFSQVAAARGSRPSGYDRFLERLDSQAGFQLSEVAWWLANRPPTVLLGLRFAASPRYLVGVLDPEILHRELTALSGDTLDRHVYVVDGQGKLIFYSDIAISQRGKDLRDNPPIRMHLQRGQGPIRFQSVVSGKERLGHVLRLASADWGVIVSADIGSRLISLHNRYQMLAWLIALAMVTAVGLLILTSRRLIRPVLQIRDALRREDRPEHGALGLPDSCRRIAEFDELIQTLDNLADRIATTEKQLIQAEKISLLGQLASGIAHEVGTPLNVITGNAQYLMRKLPEDNPACGTLSMIVKQAERITRMIRRLLDFSHPAKAELMPVDLYELVLQTKEMIAGFTGKLEIQLDHDPQTPQVLGDPKLLEHVLLNLMMNACQAMPDGGRLSMGVGVGSEKPGGAEGDEPWVCFRIADTGGGIAPEHQDKIFEPFFTTKAQGQGTGLGLAIVERIVRQHHGRIEFTSHPGVGTVFTVRLRPLARETG